MGYRVHVAVSTQQLGDIDMSKLAKLVRKAAMAGGSSAW